MPKATRHSPDWLFRTQVAREFGFPLATLAYWAARRKGPPFIRVGKRVLYFRDDLEGWLARQPRGGEPAAVACP